MLHYIAKLRNWGFTSYRWQFQKMEPPHLGRSLHSEAEFAPLRIYPPISSDGQMDSYSPLNSLISKLLRRNTADL